MISIFKKETISFSRKEFNMRIKFFLVLFLLGFALHVNAQGLQVSDVRFEDKGETVLVFYDLDGPTGKKVTINLLLSDDYGESFSIRPKTISGDVGKNVSSGIGKKIIWHIKKDYPNGLQGEGFVFAVDAETRKSRSKLPYILGGSVVIIGGAVYFATKSSGEESASTTGSIIIDVPQDF